MVELFMIEYMTVLGMTMVLLFLDSRYSKKCTILTTCATMALVVIVVAGAYLTIGAEMTLKIYSLIAHVPSLLLLFLLSRFRGWRIVFQMCSAILFCTLVHHGAGLFYYLSGNQIWALLLSYTVFSAAIIWFLVSFLRPLFLQILLELHRGWWLICLVMAVHYIIIIYFIPGYIGLGGICGSTILKPAISLLMVGYYSVLLFLFSSVRKEMEIRHSAQLSALQLSALQSRMEAVQATENIIRTERHNLRHRLQTVAELVARGDRDTALEFLNASSKRLDNQKQIHWCRPPVLDAVFSSYFNQAKNQGISVEAEIVLPDVFPVDESELAIVLANMLENAIHANLTLLQTKREIRCKMIGTPSVMLEIMNPCTGNISFDSGGLPVAQSEGHGLGMRSVSAFCQKNGAICQCDLINGWFRLRLVL